MYDHVLHVGIRVDHMADGGRLHCDEFVLLSVEVVGKIEKLHTDAAGDGGEDGEEVGGDHDSTCDAQSQSTRREFRPGGQRKRKWERSASSRREARTDTN